MLLSYLNSLGPGVGNHLWQSTVFCAVVWVVALVLRRNSARVRYGLWMVASVKFLVPFSLLIGLGGLLPRAQRAVVAAPVYSAVGSVGLPFSEIAEPVDLPVTHVVSLRERLVAQLPIVIAGMWGCGVGVVLLVWLVRWRRVAAAMRRAVRVESGREFEILRGIDTKALVGLRMSRELMEPGVFGVWRPVLLWPEALSLRLEDEHIAAIMVHELMHVRRRDNLAAMLHMVVEAAFWFHPMVWWIERRMVEERERACDEAVVEMGAAAGVYAESLLKAVRFCVESPLSCVAGISGADLKDRVVRIVTERVIRKLGFGRKALLVGVGVAAVALPIVLGVMNAPLRAQISGMSDDWVKAAGGKLAFDVASVRPSRSGNPKSNIPLGSGNVSNLSGGIFKAEHQPLLAYLEFAYKMTDYQVESLKEKLPEWVITERFNIDARTENTSVTKDQLRLMVRSLLEERFKLGAHYETRQVNVFALISVKAGTMGPKLRRDTGSTCSEYSRDMKTADGKSIDDHLQTVQGGFPAVCGGILGLPASAQDKYSFGAANVPMQLIASSLSSWGNLRRPVVDRTGLSGNYDFVLEYTPDPRPKWMTVDSGGPTFQEALKQQLGLRLEAQKSPVEFLVLDHVERPMGQDKAGLIEADPLAAPSPSASVMSSQPVLRPVALVQRIPAQRAAEVPSGPLPSFEVASVKPVGPNSSNGVGLFTYPGGRIICSQCPVQYLLMEAFNVQAFQISGPDWIKDARFDVEAKPPASSPSTKLNDPSMKTPPNQEQREMLQSLLMERFQLKFHRGTKEGDVYILEKGNKALKLTPPKDDHAFSWAGGVEGGGVYNGAGMAGKNISMAQLAVRLSGFLHRTVLDQTGISGAYDFEYRTGNDDADADVTAAIFSSMQGIGLRLKAARGPVETIVVDHVERRSEN